MPWYDFYCEDCGCEFEEFLGVNESRESIECPECNSKSIERLFSRISLGSLRRGFSDDSGCGTGGG